ncbi:MAG: U32 family peptidase [Mycoplasmataceae bacterium]|jgi:putative protease|nr:U32 family peptidase [Mycoplasmataceae bacterium]
MNKHTELLAPAGDLQRGKMAIDFGANAIYFGAKVYSLRSRASNFDYPQLYEMINYAHEHKAKAYIVSNIVCHNHMLAGVKDFLIEVMKTAPDAFLCTDPYIIKMIKSNYPRANIHISTQQSVTNSKAALFFARNGAKRIVTAREVSFNEIKEMIKNVNGQIEIEMFVHGAVCISYSGRCMLSSNMCLRDANNGGCAQSCRWVSELYLNNKSLSKTFSMSAKDMSLVGYLKDVVNSGLTSVKIEGRMKSEHYIATIVNDYRKILDALYNNEPVPKEYIEDINKAANREVSFAWFNGKPTTNEMLYHEIPKRVNQIFAMLVKSKVNENTYEVISKNYFTINNNFEILGRNLMHIEKVKLTKIINKDNLEISIVNTPMQELIVCLDKNINLESNDILRIVL